VYPRQSARLVKDPVKGVFVPLIVLSFATIIIGTINYAVPADYIQEGAVRLDFHMSLFAYKMLLHA
jgi:tellurite resistance protein TehA-like permease